MFQPRVIDIYWNDDVDSDSFVKAQKAGIWGVIHKCTQGTTFKDPKYEERRQMAIDAGLLWGAYHFNEGNNVVGQVDNFLSHCNPDENTLVCLDFEPCKNNMSVSSAISFMNSVEKRIGKTCVMYSGSRLKETIGDLSDANIEYLNSRKLWIASYTSTLHLPKGIDKWWLWQYTGDGEGQSPQKVDGFKTVDLSIYNGKDREQFGVEWID